MKKLIMICCLIMTVVFITSCENEQISTDNNTLIDKSEVNSPELFNQQFNLDEIPEATVKLKTFEVNNGISLKTVESCTDPLLPSSLVTTLQMGESVVENKTACLSGVPPKGDVLFCMDLTGSMGGALNNLKVNSINIMNSIDASIPNSEFGLISHMDYPAYYSSCEYSATYGGSGDYPYNMDQSITSSTLDVSNAIDALSLGYGSDGPESYERALFETYSDGAISWRPGAARIVVMMLDFVPHDCELPMPTYIVGTNSGSDPGRDGIMGTEDDIDMDDVIAEMVNQNIKLIVLNSGNWPVSNQPLWEYYANLTGGSAFQLNSDGTIPGGEAIEDVITDLIEESVATVSSLTLEANPGSYSSWIASIDPISHTNINLEFAQELEFDLTLTVPDGTADGLYEFNVDLVGDGAVYGTQTVAITVLSDTDGDGCLDDDDPIINSNIEATVNIDGCDYGVENRMIPGVPCGIMMSDLIDELELGIYKNHGAFVRAMAKLVNGWYDEGLVTLEEKDLIMSCAGQSSYGHK